MELQLNQKSDLINYSIDLIEKYVYTLHKMGFNNVVGSHCNYEIIKNQADESTLLRLIHHLKPAMTTISSLEIEKQVNIYDQDEAFFLKRFMFLHKLRAEFDLDAIVDDTDVIEVYDSNHIQMYRSFNFFKICSYSFEEIFTIEWWKLYERSVFVTKKLIEIGSSIIQKQIREIQAVNCPEHWVEEKNSKLGYGCYVRQNIIIPILGERGTVTAVMTPFKVLKYRDRDGNIIEKKRMANH